MAEGFQQQLPLELPRDSYDLTGMSADDIVSLHQDIHQRDLLDPTRLNEDLGEAFDAGFELLCEADLSTAANVLARFSLSFDGDEEVTFIEHLPNLTKANTAVGMALFEDMFADSEERLTSEAAEALAKVREIGALSLEQIAYLLHVRRTKPSPPARWQ